MRFVEAHVALALLLGVVEREGVQEAPHELARDSRERELEGGVLIDGVVTALEGERADVAALAIGDLVDFDDARRVAGAGGRDRVVVGTLEPVAQPDLGTAVDQAAARGGSNGALIDGIDARHARLRLDRAILAERLFTGNVAAAERQWPSQFGERIGLAAAPRCVRKATPNPGLLHFILVRRGVLGRRPCRLPAQPLLLAPALGTWIAPRSGRIGVPRHHRSGVERENTMARLWIVHRESRWRDALVTMAGSLDVLAGDPTDAARFDAASPPRAVAARRGRRLRGRAGVRLSLCAAPRRDRVGAARAPPRRARSRAPLRRVARDAGADRE